MKQRILSLFLALCMLAVAVPVFLLPAAAAEETGKTYEFRASDGSGRTNANGAGTLLSTAVGAAALANTLENGVPGAPADLIGWYTWANGEFVPAELYAAGLKTADETVTFYPVTKTTAFSANNNMPLSDPNALYGFRGGWVVGGYSDSAFTQYGALSVNGAVLTVGAGTEWDRGGMYLTEGGYAPSHMILPNYTKNAASTLRYRAIAAGEVTFALPKIEVADSGAAAVMAIAHNGVYLWPAALAGKAVSDIATDKASFADAPADTLTFALTLAADDTVDVLLVRKENAGVGTAAASPTVTYTGNVQVDEIRTRFEQATGGVNFPQVNDSVVSQSAQWKVGRFKSGSFAAFDDASQGSLIRVTGEDEWGNGAIYTSDLSSGGVDVPNMTVLGNSGNYVTAVQYTAPVNAKLNIALTASFVNAGSAYAVLRNNEIIWPKSGAAFTGDYKEGDWALTTAAKGAVSVSLSDIVVAAGDTISFVADRGTSGSGRGFYGLQMQIAGNRYGAVSRALNNLPAAAGESGASVTFPGPWSFVNYANADNITADNARLMNVLSGKEFWVDNTGKPGDVGSYKAAVYHEAAAYWGGQPGTIAVVSGAAAGWRYTAEVSGFAQVDFAEFGNYAMTNPAGDVPAHYFGDGTVPGETLPAYTYAIFRNGQKIWPKDGWYTVEGMTAGGVNHAATVNAAVAAAFPDGIFLATGDNLEVLCKAPVGISIYGGRGNRFAPTVTVAEKVADPALAFRANLNDTFSLTFDLTAVGASDMTLTYTINGETQTVACTRNGNVFSAVTAGVVASDMTAPITYTLQGKVGSQDYQFAAGETTFAAVMMRYVEAYRGATDAKGKAIYELAVATLNYGAVAQERFNKANTTLPNKDLTEAEKALVKTGKTATASRTTDENVIYTFAGATLLLKDTVQLKVVIDAQEGKTAPDASGLKLRYWTKADESDAQECALETRGDMADSAYLKAALTIRPTAYAETYYMCVVDGADNVISTILTYSVAAYAARMPAEEDITARIITMGAAAEAYVAATKA